MTTIAETAPLKEIQKFIWSQGDFGQLARQVMPTADALVQACGVAGGELVLDVAAGTGNAAVAAARRGACVIASDITPQMVQWGKGRCARERLAVEWVEADAEALPFEADRFDHALSTFGAMFAPDPGAVVAELFRVVRPGGRVGLANWTPGSFVGQLLATIASHMPPRPEGVPSPVEWGDEEVVRSRLEGFATELRIERRSVTVQHPSPEAMWEFQRQHTGPLVAARMALGDRFQALAGEVRELIAQLNRATDGSARVPFDYLLVVAANGDRSAGGAATPETAGMRLGRERRGRR